MKEERYFYVPDAENSIELPEEEATHAARVLRLKEGDSCYIMDGKGVFFKAEITLVSNKHCTYNIIERSPQKHQWHRKFHIVMAPTKMMERTEWMVEKATEIGVDEFSFIECQYSERRKMRHDRVDKIAVAAMKQSRKAWKPVVNELVTFDKFIESHREGKRFICHCYNEIERTDLFEELTHDDTNEEIIILIGPEGDFSIDEVRKAIQNGYKSVSLGSSRLRTETAALSAVMISHLSNKKQ